MSDLREQIAKKLFQLHGEWSVERANEFFALYRRGPKNLEPEFMIEVREAYEDADAAISVFTRHYSNRLKNLEARILALEALRKTDERHSHLPRLRLY